MVALACSVGRHCKAVNWENGRTGHLEPVVEAPSEGQGSD